MYKEPTDSPSVPVTGAARRTVSRWVWHGLIIVFVAAAAWKYIDFAGLMNSLVDVQPTFIFLIFLLITIHRFVMAWKWFQLIRAIKIAVSFVVVLNAYYQAAFIGRISPTSLSGDVLRGYLVTRQTEAWEPVLGSMVVEKAIGVLASVMFATVGVFVLSGELQREGFSFIILAIPTVGILSLLVFYLSLSESLGARLLNVVRWEKINRPLTKLHKAYCLYNEQRRILLVNFCLTLGEQALLVLYLWVAAMAIGVEITPWVLIAALALGQFLRKIAIVLEGWVLGEFILVSTCVLAGIDQTQALAFSLLSHAIGILASIPGGILMFVSRQRLVDTLADHGTKSTRET